LQLKMTNKEAALTNDQADRHFKSIEEFSLQIEHNPDQINPYFGRALDFMLLQDLSEAISDLDKIVEINANFLMAYFNRASIRFKQIQLLKNEDHQSTFNEESFVTLNYSFGKNKNLISKNNNAKITADESLSSKDNKHALQFEQIIHDYDMCLRINPDFVFAYYNRGNIRCYLKDFRSAIQDYSEAIRRYTDFAEAYFNRGLALLYTGDAKKGIEDLSKAGELGLINACLENSRTRRVAKKCMEKSAARNLSAQIS